MKKIIVAVVVSTAGLVACSSQAQPVPTVTITEQPPLPAPTTDDGVTTSSQDFIDFVRNNGGMYASVASDLDLIELGSTICQGFEDGLSEDEITYVLAQALIKNDMNNDEGIKLAAALMVGAKNYLCGPTY